eukprot:TRINITY_DN9869_c0_g2_i2.p1 TRINITY_DN9869_c0_g2~~TRINITY_DN9869_c0_g2_i2.p1  ORF type:complete len:1202 (-),score=121.45 TRINITY_DN9869_c0_g2_i2:263-3868(-)
MSDLVDGPVRFSPRTSTLLYVYTLLLSLPAIFGRSPYTSSCNLLAGHPTDWPLRVHISIQKTYFILGALGVMTGLLEKFLSEFSIIDEFRNLLELYPQLCHSSFSASVDGSLAELQGNCPKTPWRVLGAIGSTTLHLCFLGKSKPEMLAKFHNKLRMLNFGLALSTKATLKCSSVVYKIYWFLSACAGLLGCIRQLSSGHRRQHHAKNKLKILPPKVSIALFKASLGHADKTDFLELAAFLMRQLRFTVRYSEAPAGGSLYTIFGRRESYVGMSAATVHASLGCSPARRLYDHTLALVGQRFGNKCATTYSQFLSDNLADIAFYWLCDLPSIPALQLAEETHIKQCNPTANTTHNKPTNIASSRRRPLQRHRLKDSSKVEAPTASTVSSWISHHCQREWPPSPQPAGGGTCKYTWMLQLPFHKLYLTLLTLASAKSGIQTVLHVACCLPLLLQWLCQKQRNDYIEVALRFGGIGGLYQIAHAMSHHPKPGLRQRGLRRMAWIMKWCAQLPLQTVCFRMPHNLKPSKIWKQLALCKEALAEGVPQRWAWLREHLRCVKTPADTILKKRLNMIAVMKRAQWSVYLAMSKRQLAEIQRSNDLQRIKVWGKFVDVMNGKKMRRLLSQEIYKLTSQLRLAEPVKRQVHSALILLLPGIRDPLPPSISLCNFIASYPRPGANEVLIIEDKDTAAAWMGDALKYQMRVFKMLDQDKNWSKMDISLDDCARLRVQAVGKISSELLHPGLKKWLVASADQSHIPYGYATIKSKCHQGDASIASVHSCTKPGHSCMRKIISWACVEHGVRRAFKLVSQAATLLAYRFVLGLETPDLKSSATDLKKGLGMLCQPTLSCKSCKARKQPYAFLVCDAAQMYEQLQAADVMKSLEYCVDRATKLGFKSVGVRTSRRLAGCLLKKQVVSLPNTHVVQFADVLKVIALSLEMRWVRFGDAVFFQKIGSPIGGLMSKVHASLACGLPETKWLVSNPSCVSSIAAKRYVDDICAVSPNLCNQCLETSITAIYPRHIAFNAEQSNTYGVAWLDLHVSLDSLGKLPEVSMAEVELEWLQGKAAFPAKQRMPPFLESCATDWHYLKQRVTGLRARWKQVGLSHAQYHICVTSWVSIMLKLNYPRSMVYKCFRQWGGPAVAACIIKWQRFYSSQQRELQSPCNSKTQRQLQQRTQQTCLQTTNTSTGKRQVHFATTAASLHNW